MSSDTSPQGCQAVTLSNTTAPAPTVSEGVRLNGTLSAPPSGVGNVLFNYYGCEFVASNSSSNDYFVPQASQKEFMSFLQNPPVGVTFANCILPISYTASPAVSNASFAIFAEGGAVNPMGAGTNSPITNINVPTNQTVNSGIMEAPATTTVSVINQSTMQPIQFYYTREDCVNDPFLSPPVCNTWIIRETQTITFTAPATAGLGVNSSWMGPPTPVVNSTYAIGTSLSGPWTPVTVNGVPGGVPGIYNNDYQPPTVSDCTSGGVTYADGQTWTAPVNSTQPATLAECPYGSGTRVDQMSTPTDYICNNGTATVQSSGVATETGFVGACAALPACPATSAAWDGAANATYASGEAPPVGNPPNFTLAYETDFTGALDATWTLVNAPADPSELAAYSSSACSQSGGVLHLNTSFGGSGWTTCKARQSTALTYGKYLVRFRADLGDGMSPATLILSPSGATLAQDYLFESWSGQAANMQGDYNSDNGDGTRTAYATFWEPENYTTQWHTMGVEWTPNNLVYTIDGTAYSTFNNSVVTTYPMVLNLLQELISVDAGTPSSSTYDVNWVAEYSYSPGSAATCP